MEASTADELTSAASGAQDSKQISKDVRRGPVKPRRRHPVARVKGCWQAEEDDLLVRCEEVNALAGDFTA